MTVSRRGITSGTQLAGSNFVATKPTGTVDGDLIFILSCSDGNTGSLSAPDGSWTSLFTAVNPTTDGQQLSGYYKVASSEGASWTFPHNFSSGNDLTWAAISYTGQHATWQDATPVRTTNSSSNSSVVTIALTGITTANNNSMVVWIGIGDPNSQNNGTIAVPSGYSSAMATYTNFSPLAIGDLVQSTAGATGTLNGSLTFSSGVAGFGGVVIAIRDAGGGGGTSKALLSMRNCQGGF